MVDWERYRVLTNRIKKLNRDARTVIWVTFFQPEKPSKDLWNVLINQGTGKQSKSIVDPYVDLNNLNEYFWGITNHIVDLLDYYTSNKSWLDNVFSFSEVD